MRNNLNEKISFLSVNCKFCQESSSFQLTSGLITEKYWFDFYFYLAKPINEMIVEIPHSADNILYVEMKYMDDSISHFNEYYYKKDSLKRLAELTGGNESSLKKENSFQKQGQGEIIANNSRSSSLKDQKDSSISSLILPNLCPHYLIKTLDKRRRKLMDLYLRKGNWPNQNKLNGKGTRESFKRFLEEITFSNIIHPKNSLIKPLKDCSRHSHYNIYSGNVSQLSIDSIENAYSDILLKPVKLTTPEPLQEIDHTEHFLWNSSETSKEKPKEDFSIYKRVIKDLHVPPKLHFPPKIKRLPLNLLKKRDSEFSVEEYLVNEEYTKKPSPSTGHTQEYSSKFVLERFAPILSHRKTIASTINSITQVMTTMGNQTERKAGRLQEEIQKASGFRTTRDTSSKTRQLTTGNKKFTRKM